MEAKRIEFQEAGSAQLGGMLLEFSWHGPRASLEEQKIILWVEGWMAWRSGEQHMWSQSSWEGLAVTLCPLYCPFFPSSRINDLFDSQQFHISMRDQPYFEKLRISDNWEALPEHIKLPCPPQLPPSQAAAASGIPRELAWNEAAVREQVGTAHMSRQPPALPCELPGNGISAWEPLLLPLRLRREPCAGGESGRAAQPPCSLLSLPFLLALS